MKIRFLKDMRDGETGLTIKRGQVVDFEENLHQIIYTSDNNISYFFPKHQEGKLFERVFENE